MLHGKQRQAMNTESAERPKRRTVQRLLIAVAGFGVLIGACSWLLRPRVDPRFVGTWTVQVIGTESPPSGLVFDDDGEGIATPVLNGPHPDVAFFWRAEAERLTLIHKPPLMQRIGRALHQLFTGGSAGMNPGETYRISEVSPDAIVLDVGVVNGQKVEWHLRRSE
jgi:hypothetical protein